MSRGKQLKTKIKEAVTEASLVASAIAIGEHSAHDKIHQKKPLTESFREHLGKAIDRIDPLEMAATIAGTLLVHEVLIKSTEVMGKLEDMAKGTPTSSIVNVLTGWFSTALGQGGTLGGSGGIFLEKTAYDEILLWALSFYVSYMVTKHSGDILGIAKKAIGI